MNYRNTIVFLFAILASQVGLAQSFVLAHESNSVEKEKDSIEIEYKYVKWWEFDHELVPCADMYNFSWDSLNVSLPMFDARDSSEGIHLHLIDSDCGYYHPCAGDINSEFGWRHYRMHNGIDIDLEIGDPIYAAFDGVVRIAKFNHGGYGNYVMIRHYNGLETLYGHLSERLVEPNQTVRAGDVIGLGGNTGRSTGPHLHFETRYKGMPINPKQIICFDSNRLVQDSLHLNVTDFKIVVPKNISSTSRSTSSYYRVKSGDTLWAISKKYGTSVDRICKLNGINKNGTLSVGQKLKIR